MPTGSYTIDATNNAEPLDSRYVADFPAELRAMKTRMNAAISSIGELTGALMADGTNYMTGKLGVGTVADSGIMLHVAGASKFAGDLNVLGKVAVTNTGFVPSNAAVGTAAIKASGAYGGGVVMVDGAHYSGMYAQSGELFLGSGTASGIGARAQFGPTATLFYGDTNCNVEGRAANGYTAFSIKSSGTNAAYLLFGNGEGEKSRIVSDNAGNLNLCVGNNIPAAYISATKNLAIYGDEINIGASSGSGQKRLSFQSSTRLVYFYLNSDQAFGLYDGTVGASRWTSYPTGDFNVARNVSTNGSSLNVGSGAAGEKIITLSNSVRAVNLELSADGAVSRFVDYVAGVVHWSTDVSGNFTAAGNITAYSDARLKHDVQRITGALDIVQAMRGVTFKWNRDNSAGIGFIAQEVEKVLPELVLDSGSTKSVAYGNVTAVLVEAIKELRAEVEDLRTQLKFLKAR